MSETMTFDARGPRGLRAIFVGLGLFAIVAATWELGPALWPPSPLSLFFGLIVAGAWSVGLPMIYGGLFGESGRFTVRPGQIELAWETAFSAGTTVVPAGDVGAPEVVRVDRDGGPDVYRVRLPITGRRPIETPDLADEATATRLAAAIVARLRG